ncbi:MAG: HEAT repeat domain-containing protein [Methanoregulaceae archaeon]
MTEETTTPLTDDEKALAQLEKDGFDGLTGSLLESPEPQVRRHSAYLLGISGNHDAIPYLVCALKDREKAVREQAAIALAQLGKASVVPLVTLLRDHVWQTRYRAAEALGQIRDERSIEPLVASLNDERDHVRYMAAKALGQIRNEYAIPFLIVLLKDENTFVRSSAASSLGLIGGGKAKDALTRARESEQAPNVREAIESALKQVSA